MPVTDETDDEEEETEEEEEEEEDDQVENVDEDEARDNVNVIDNQSRTSLQNTQNGELLENMNENMQHDEQLASQLENLANANTSKTQENSAESNLHESRNEFDEPKGAVGGAYSERDGLPYLQLRREHEDSDVEMREEERDADVETMATGADDADDDGENVDGEDGDGEEEEVEDEGVEEVVHVMDHEDPVGVAGGLHAAHHALLDNRQPTHFEPYNKPNIFHIRVSTFTSLVSLVSLIL